MTIDIKSAVNLADLIGKKYNLTGQGRYLKTKEHDSLVIDTQSQTYYWNSRSDGSRTESGDVIDWVGRNELGYNGQWNSADPTLFKEALVWLASYAGLPEPQFRPEDAQARAERLTADRLMTLAADYYSGQMARHVQPWMYARGRGLPVDLLGYADGRLWQTIPESDRDQAAELGLIYRNGRGWRDSIYKGNLVYIHRHKGRVEYLTGRYIAEKRHVNLRAPKRLFWAENGYKSLIICEGQADALSLYQMGYSALALCGTSLSDFDSDLVNLYGTLYVWPDADDPDSEAGRAWARRLAELADALGPDIRIIDAPTKDANEFLQAGYTAEALEQRLKEAGTFLDLEIKRLNNLYGAELYDEYEPLFRRLADLDVFKLNIYRSKICKKLNLSQGDFSRYLKAAKGTLSEDEESDFAKGGQYEVIDGWTVLKKVNNDGTRSLSPLANASVRILEEVAKDDGSNDPFLDFVIGGELATGQKLQRIDVPAEEFAGMKWAAKWGARFVLSAGRSTQDHFRAAVQHLSGTPPRRRIYTHTGWREIDGERVFLTGSGALGKADERIQVDLSMGRPDTNMARYALPLKYENVGPAVLASLNSWHIADPAVTVPLWAAMHLAPLFPFLSPDFGLWLHGQTGSMKSSMVAAFLAHYGNWQGKDAKIFLPSNFQSTANNILMNAFQAKDVPLVIDDFAPGATQREVRERDNTASNLLRSVGNKAARGRMRDGRSFQADFPPRCLAIITAEDLPKTQSIMARGIGVSVQTPRKGEPGRAEVEQRLSQSQSQDSYLYPHAMAAYISWIKRHWDELETSLPVMATKYRDEMSAAGHARLPDAFGKLMAAVDTALYFAMDTGAITEFQARERKEQAFSALGQMITEHGEVVDSVDATSIFREVLIEQLDSREWYLCPVDADSTRPPVDYPPGCQVVGYVDDHLIYLNAKTVTQVMELYQRLGTPFPLGRNTLYKRLIERGWLIPGAKKTTDTVYVNALGTSPRVLKLVRSEIFND